MSRLLLFGLLCALAPWLLARCRFVFGGLTRTLVYLLAGVQVLIVPLLIAMEPDISFGSDSYSLGAGIAIVLIGAIEFLFVTGTAVGLLAALSFLRREDAAEARAKAEAMFGPVHER
jgi:hypothetical protein